jgi:hypothetical protein
MLLVTIVMLMVMVIVEEYGIERELMNECVLVACK